VSRLRVFGVNLLCHDCILCLFLSYILLSAPTLDLPPLTPGYSHLLWIASRLSAELIILIVIYIVLMQGPYSRTNVHEEGHGPFRYAIIAFLFSSSRRCCFSNPLLPRPNNFLRLRLSSAALTWAANAATLCVTRFCEAL